MKSPFSSQEANTHLGESTLAFLRLTIWVIVVGEVFFVAFIVLFAPAQMHRLAGPVSMLSVALTTAYLLWRDKVQAAM